MVNRQPILEAVEFSLQGDGYRVQMNAAHTLQVMLWNQEKKEYEHTHHEEHLPALHIGYRLFSCEGQALDPRKYKRA